MIPTTSKTEFLFSLIKVVESSVWEGGGRWKMSGRGIGERDRGPRGLGQ